MKNKYLIINIFNFFVLFFVTIIATAEEFVFDVKEIEIKENGNKYFGKNGGKATTPDGLYFRGENFIYDKKLNILFVEKNIKFFDEVNNYEIYSDKATYLKNEEKIFTEGNSKAINEDGVIITADRLSYDKGKNIIEAIGNVYYLDKKKNIEFYSNKITYFKNLEKIFSNGNSKLISNNEIELISNKMSYDKNSNIVEANGNIKFSNKVNNYEIYSDKATYLKNEEKIFTEGNSKAINEDGVIITADRLLYDQTNNISEADGNAQIIDNKKDYSVNSKKINYNIEQDIITTFGDTEVVVESNYIFKSNDIIFYRNKMQLISNKYSTMNDTSENTFYELKKFKYFLNDKVLKGNGVSITTNINGEKSDKFYFKDLFTNIKKKNFKASKTEILFHKSIFDKEREKFIDLENAKLNELFEDYYQENSPRLYGVSSSGDNNKTIVNKGVFTSCKKTNSCPAWNMKAEKITHDKIKKQVVYKNTVLEMFDIPVFYFPKFFHPDPTVKRQSGFLKPQINESKTLGSSLYLPYFHVISDNKDLTFKSTLFDKDIFMFQNEYRQENKNSSFISDFGVTKGYKSTLEGSKKNTITHLFAKFTSDLNLENFLKSDLEINLQKTSNDTYLRLFDANIPETEIKPKNNNVLTSKIKFDLDHENYNFSTGSILYETLSGTNSDRYQYVFPYYNFDRSIENNLGGNISFSSSGSNTLQNTNNLITKISNSIGFTSKDYFSNLGFKNNFGLHLKNFNATAKNDAVYKSNLQSELMTIFELSSSLPLVKWDDDKLRNSLTPKISLKFNPTDMKNHSNKSRNINADNIFSLNRLGIEDSFESGRSLTLGIDYIKENINDEDKFLEFKLATVLRDKYEEDIPVSSTINRKNSNIFGSFTNNFSELIQIDYDFAIDNDFSTFDYNSIGLEFSLNNFVTEFNFTEKNGIMGDENSIGNITSIKFDESNYFTFNTRRNRKTSLTEYYDLVYEYKNDCLTAGIKYKKTYYNDRDIKPNEDLMFTITLFPLTSFEQKVDESLY